MSSLLSAELSATCNALGYFDGTKYYIDEHTLETVKDLIRYLRRDDDTHEIRRHLGHAKVVQSDLLHILVDYSENEALFDVLLRLLVNLTNPPLLLYKEEIPVEKTSRNYYLQLISHLQEYKQAFANSTNVWNVLSTKLSNLLEIEWQERSEEKGLVIERILILVRNILQVPADIDAEKRPDNDASVHDQVLWALHQSNVVDIFLYIATSENEQIYYMHILEITSLMLREQSAESLASSELQRSVTEKARDDAELASIRRQENLEKHKKVRIYNGCRHSRFGGTFVIQDMKSISNNDLIYHKPLSKLNKLNFDLEKKRQKKPKNRMPVRDTRLERRSAFGVRLILKEFCIEFLTGAYNTLMHNVKDLLVRAKTQDHDESYYLWALKFFMEFNRFYKFDLKYVSETMSTHTFHYVQQQIEVYFDMINTDKKKIPQWSRRLHIGLKAYRELLFTIMAMDKCPDGTVRDAAKVIKSNIFYVVEYREILLTMLLCFDELKMSMSYLNDLIETQHIFMKMLEGFCKQDGLVVQRKVRAKKKKKRTKKPTQTPAPSQPFNVENQWDEVAPQLSAVLQSGAKMPSDIVPFDAASEVSIDNQKADAMRKIQKLLRQHKYEDAVGLLRAAREVWPENDSFGNSTMAPDEEFMAMREIFFADIQDENELQEPTILEPVPDESESDEEDEEDELAQTYVSETDFNFEDFINRFANPKVVRACALLLRNFEKNDPNSNHCVIKLLHRIAWDCKMPAMIFQASLFRTFQRILRSHVAPNYKELVKFAVFIIRKFTEVAQKNPKIYMEMLFWKNSREAYDVEQGYGSYTEKSAASKKAWTELEEDELRRLFMEHKNRNIETDVVDWICENLIDNTKSRRIVLCKLKEMHLLSDYKKSGNKSVSARFPKEFSQEEEQLLSELYGEFKDTVDPLGSIMARLIVRRPKRRIVEKLLSMGLVQDNKDLRKKRTKKSLSGKSMSKEANSDSDISSSENSDSDDSCNNITQKGSKKQSENISKPVESRRPKVNIKPVSNAVLGNHLKIIIDKGMKEVLQWLIESLSDAADDMEQDDEDDDDEGIPLVPISEHATNAMNDADFIDFLRVLGIIEPFNEQEIYWRIPGSVSPQFLRNHCTVIQNALDGNFNLEDNNPADANNSDDESSDDYTFMKLNDSSKPRDDEVPNTRPINSELRQKENLSIAINSNNENNFLKNDPNNQKYSKKLVFGNSESENEEELISRVDDLKQKKTDKIKKKQSRMIMNSDSEEDINNDINEKANGSSDSKKESEDEIINELNDYVNNDDSKQKKNTNSNLSFKTRKFVDSDSEEEERMKYNKRNRSNENLSDVYSVKKPKLISSDEED